jgi:hypothetical protein
VQAWRLKPSLRKLQRSRSLIMGTYYGFLWAITILNLVRCILQMARNGTSSTHASLWNALWLVTRFGECAAHTCSSSFGGTGQSSKQHGFKGMPLPTSS